MNLNELEQELEKWFIKNINYKDKWSRKVGRIIQKYLIKSDNWKGARRGKPGFHRVNKDFEG